MAKSCASDVTTGRSGRLRGRSGSAYASTVRRVLAGALAIASGFGLNAFLVSHAALAQGAYTVANYPVYASARDAVTAKREALKDGQQAALRSLLKRLVPVTAYDNLRALPEADASRFIEGMAVKSEQNSAREYIATINFRFSADAVRRHLASQGVPFVDSQSRPVTLVAITKNAATGAGEADAGQWGRIWRDLDLQNALTPVEVKGPGRALAPDALAALAEADPDASRRLASDYGAVNTVAAVAIHDANTGRLMVTLTGRDDVGAFDLKRSYLVPDGDLAYAMEYAAVVSLGILEGRWKAAQGSGRAAGGARGGGQQIALEVSFASPAQWYQIEGDLRALPGVAGLRTESMSARRADVLLSYPGGAAGLGPVLARQGYSLTQAGQRWVLRRTF